MNPGALVASRRGAAGATRSRLLSCQRPFAAAPRIFPFESGKGPWESEGIRG